MNLSAGPFVLVAIIPLTYGILYWYVVPDKIVLGPGLSTMNLVLFFRYIIYPPLLKIDGYFDSYYLVTDVYKAIIIQLVEIAVILFTVRFFSKYNAPKNRKYMLVKIGENQAKNFFNNRNMTKINPINTSMNGIIPVFLMIISLIIIFTHSDIYANRHFFLKSEMIVSEKVLFETDAWSLVVRWAEILLTLFVVSYIYKRKKSLFWCSLILLLPNLFYFGNSRLSILIPLVVTMFLLVKMFQEHRRKIFLSLGSFVFISMVGLTLVKSFGSSSLQNVEFIRPSSLLNAYFGGLENVVIGLNANKLYSDQISILTFFNDMFRNGLGISSYFISPNNSSYFFNEAFYKADSFVFFDQIIPTVIQGIFYFGYFLFWILTVIMVSFVSFADKIYAKSERIEIAWLFAFLSVSVAWAIPGSFQHLYILLHQTFLPLIFIMYINEKLKKLVV
jgi:hypothetical protein